MDIRLHSSSIQAKKNSGQVSEVPENIPINGIQTTYLAAKDQNINRHALECDLIFKHTPTQYRPMPHWGQQNNLKGGSSVAELPGKATALGPQEAIRRFCALRPDSKPSIHQENIKLLFHNCNEHLKELSVQLILQNCTLFIQQNVRYKKATMQLNFSTGFKQHKQVKIIFSLSTCIKNRYYGKLLK